MIRQRSLGEILDAALRCVRDQAPTLGAVTLVYHAIPSVVADLVDVGPSDPDTLWTAEDVVETFAIGMAGFLASVATVHVVREAASGRRPSPSAALGAPLRDLGAVLAAGALMNLAFLAGLLCFVLPGIYVALGLFVVAPVLVVERARPGATLARSWTLMRGHKLRALGVLCAFLALGLPLEFLSSWSLPWSVQVLASSLVWALVTLLVDVAMVHLYFDIRVRKEAYELEHLALEVERASRPGV